MLDTLTPEKVGRGRPKVLWLLYEQELARRIASGEARETRWAEAQALSEWAKKANLPVVGGKKDVLYAPRTIYNRMCRRISEETYAKWRKEGAKVFLVNDRLPTLA